MSSLEGCEYSHQTNVRPIRLVQLELQLGATLHGHGVADMDWGGLLQELRRHHMVTAVADCQIVGFAFIPSLLTSRL